MISVSKILKAFFCSWYVGFFASHQKLIRYFLLSFSFAVFQFLYFVALFVNVYVAFLIFSVRKTYSTQQFIRSIYGCMPSKTNPINLNFNFFYLHALQNVLSLYLWLFSKCETDKRSINKTKNCL